MKAAQITQYGDASVVAISKDVPRPPTGGGKVLVEVHAASLNPADSSIRLGYMHQMMPLHFPATLGIDIAGVVVDAESGIGGLKAGDRVFGTASVMAGGSGAFAEYASVPAGLLAKAPAGLSFAEAAALPLAGVSALQALEMMKLSKGSTILIQGGSGGIGTFAIQMAKQLGARVIATCRGSAVDYVKSGKYSDTSASWPRSTWGGMPFSMVARTIELLATEVAPVVRQETATGQIPAGRKG